MSTSGELMDQNKQSEWHEQWSLVECNELFLFKDWILPNKVEDFKDKDILECGCGGGQHTGFAAPFAKEYYAVDLNTSDLAKKRNSNLNNVTYVEADIATMDLKRKFDVVFSIGVVHHTDDPDKTIENLVKHVAPGGKIIIWVYSKEGNFMVEHMVEPIRKAILCNMSRKSLLQLSRAITALMYLPIYSLYLLPLRFLPFYEYFQNFRKMSFERNALNVFDKLNAPQVQFITKERVEKWSSENQLETESLTPYMGVSWRWTGLKKKN